MATSWRDGLKRTSLPRSNAPCMLSYGHCFLTCRGGSMHILIGLIVVVAGLIFAPWIVAIAVGLMASYWAFGLIIFVAVACWLLAAPVARMIRGSVADLAARPAAPVAAGGCMPKESFVPVVPAKPVAKSEAPPPVVRLSPCGSCGEQIKKSSMYCPRCGRDPRTKH